MGHYRNGREFIPSTDDLHRVRKDLDAAVMNWHFNRGRVEESGERLARSIHDFLFMFDNAEVPSIIASRAMLRTEQKGGE